MTFDEMIECESLGSPLCYNCTNAFLRVGVKRNIMGCRAEKSGMGVCDYEPMRCINIVMVVAKNMNHAYNIELAILQREIV